MTSKIFCIGFHKTGTTSLKHALKKLGYKVTGPNGKRDPEIDKNVFKIAEDRLKRFNAFQDNPWPVIYKEMDKKYPGSKFILTVRDSESWIKSQVRHFGENDTPMRKWIYGVGHPEGNEEIYLKRYESHNLEVQEYFKNRPEDLLIMNLGKGDGWEKLCPFLGKAIPDLPFPHSNRAERRERNTPEKKTFLQKFQQSISSIFSK